MATELPYPKGIVDQNAMGADQFATLAVENDPAVDPNFLPKVRLMARLKDGWRVHGTEIGVLRESRLESGANQLSLLGGSSVAVFRGQRVTINRPSEIRQRPQFDRNGTVI